MIKTNIYDNRIYFALIYDNKFVEILEPSKWNSINSRIPRDPNLFGFMSDFLEDKYGMQFSFNRNVNGVTGGGEILKSIHDDKDKGPDYLVYFEFGIKKSNTYEQINRWRVNLKEYSAVNYGNNFGGVSATIEKMPFQGKLRARANFPCTINGYSTVDGNLLTPISSSTIRLHSKSIPLTTITSSASPQRSNEYFGPLGVVSNLVFQTDMKNIVTNELKDVFTLPFAIINQLGAGSATPSPVNIFNDFLCQYTTTTSGFLDISISGTFDFWLWHNNRQLQTAGIEPRWNGKVRILVQRLIAGTWTIVTDITGTSVNIDSLSPGYGFTTPPTDVLPSVTGGDRNFCNKVPISFSHDEYNIPIDVGDNVYVFYLISPTVQLSDSNLVIQGDNYLGQSKFKQLTSTPASNALGYRVFDIINQIIEYITNEKDSFESSFFSKGGPGYDFFLLNGYSIRNFGGVAYNFKKDFDSIISDLQSIFCLAAGVKKVLQENGQYKEKYCLEYITDFFTDNVIITLKNTLNWKDLGTTNTFNSAELGYNKFEGLNIKQNDEICTSAYYSFQKVKTNANPFSKKSNLVAAGYIIEDQRRNQFLSNPSQTLTYDNDIFIVSTTEKSIFENIKVAFKDFDSTVEFYKNMNLNPGDTFTVYTGPTGIVGVVFTIVKQMEGYPIIQAGTGAYIDIYYVNPLPLTTSAYLTTVEILPSSPDQVFSERDEPFEICSNVSDPSSIYNGRITPKGILYNWRPFLGVSLYFTDQTAPDYVSRIVTGQSKMNSLFTHKYISGREKSSNAGTLTISEIADETVQKYKSNGDDLYLPFKAECEVNIGFNEYNLIRLALAGELKEPEGTLKNRGGVILGDCFGKLWFCHVIDFRYNFTTQIAYFLVYKKREVTV